MGHVCREHCGHFGVSIVVIQWKLKKLWFFFEGEVISAVIVFRDFIQFPMGINAHTCRNPSLIELSWPHPVPMPLLLFLSHFPGIPSLPGAPLLQLLPTVPQLVSWCNIYAAGVVVLLGGVQDLQRPRSEASSLQTIWMVPWSPQKDN